MIFLLSLLKWAPIAKWALYIIWAQILSPLSRPNSKPKFAAQIFPRIPLQFQSPAPNSSSLEILNFFFFFFRAKSNKSV